MMLDIDLSKEKFAHLINKAINIDEDITKRIVDECKIDIITLGLWSEGKNIPEPADRMKILQNVIITMTYVLRDTISEIKKAEE
jgi:hypothetical protein